MSATIEYRGLAALEYAAQTGAQLLRQRSPDATPQAIDAMIAHALWKHGAADQIVCIAVDHRALAKTQPVPSWAYTIRRAVRRSARASVQGARRLGALADQIAFLVRAQRGRTRQAETQL
jgi:hypothetical protein